MSEWRQQAAQRRDTRNTRGPVRPQGGSKKDTARWCRGKIGHEHSPQCVPYNDVKGTEFAPVGWKLLVCTECGKHLDHYMPSSFVRDRSVQPAWVK